MILEGSLDQNNALDQIELTLEVLESKLYPGRESSFHGTVSYLDSIIYAVDPVMLIIGESILEVIFFGTGCLAALQDFVRVCPQHSCIYSV